MGFTFVPKDQLDESNAFFAAGGHLGVGRPRQFATLQNPNSILAQQMARYQAKEAIGSMEDTQAMQENLAPMVVNDIPDADLVRAQYARGGDYLRSIMPQGTPQPRLISGGGMDYSGIKPMRSEEELFSNPKFSHLARVNPEAAAKVFGAVTGRDLGEVLSMRQKTTMARENDFTEAVRGGIAKGDLRQNPDTGMIERKISVNDPNNPLQKIDSWEPAEAEFQSAATRNWENATGARMFRPNPITQLGIPAQLQPQFLATYRANLAAKMAPKEAMEAAIKSLPDPNAKAPAPASTPQAAAANPPPTDPVAYQAWATAQTKAQADSVLSAMAPVNMLNSIGGAQDMALEGTRILGNSAVGLYNLPNKISTFFTGSPMYPWAQPATKESMASRAKPRTLQEQRQWELEMARLRNQQEMESRGGTMRGLDY